MFNCYYLLLHPFFIGLLLLNLTSQNLKPCLHVSFFAPPGMLHPPAPWVPCIQIFSSEQIIFFLLRICGKLRRGLVYQLQSRLRRQTEF